ncbi:amino acid permease [Bacillus sp. CGMCC 1.16541]|uniref:amino acid permease n=1 Tax=Bacillus sp. CGMCC 1.16541 TaxID=2185143 RepID=UPI000D73A5A5|nr:amino acid permease [Bacillus sp. CGMCC 1.16541]
MEHSGCSAPKQESGDLKWWQLSLIGVGCIIGTGFFLASGIAIKKAGLSTLLAFLIAAFSTYIVFNTLAKMTANDPQKGSFCAYAKNAYGHWAGFSCGWVYWFSEILIMGSQLTALSIFSKFWFPNIPLWLFASGYAILGLAVLLAGTKGFERLENVFALMKIGAIVMFIIIALLAVFGVLKSNPSLNTPNTVQDFLGTGFLGLWGALIYAFYAFGGIEIMGLMAINLKEKKEAAKSGTVMLIVLTSIYILSVGLAILLTSRSAFNQKESPFVTALSTYNLDFFPHVFNAALIIAGFSTMIASMFAVTNLLVTLAEDQDAPALFAKKGKGKLKVALPSLGLTTLGLASSILVAFLMPGKVYEYITTAAGLMLLYNWFFILLSSRKLLELTTSDKVKQFLSMGFIALAISGTIIEKSSRPSFFISLVFVGLIGLVLIKMKSVWKKEKAET